MIGKQNYFGNTLFRDKLLLALLMFGLSLFLYPENYLNLSDTQLKEIETRGYILERKKIEKAPWPEVTVYSVLDATPVECAAVFCRYEEHKLFIPDLLESKIVKTINHRDIHVQFLLDIPWPLANSRFTTGNRLSLPKEGVYQVDWYHVRSDSSKRSYGSIVFVPYQGKTLIRYVNFAHPKSGLAKLFKKKMIKKSLATVQSIKERILEMKGHGKDALNAYIEAFKSSVQLK